MRKNFKWKIKDLIDLDYLLFLRKNTQNLKSEDRQFYLDKMSSSVDFKKNILNQKNFIYLWLDLKKSEIKKSSQFLPGEIFESVSGLTFVLFCLIFFVSGLFASFGFLSYTGSSPINVFYYFGLFAGLQLFFLPFAVLPFFINTNKSLLNKFSFLSPLSFFFKIFFKKIFHKYLNKNNKYNSDKFFIKDFSKYNKPLFWLFFTITQFIVMAFSLGVLTGTVIKVAASDLAFGWQTTLNAGPEYIYKIVQTLSLPWSWFVPSSIAAPSLEQIEGTKIILKEKMAFLETADMISWWPFLCFSVLFYAVIPRFFIMVFSYLFYKKTLKDYPKDSSELRELVRSLENPELDFKTKQNDLDNLNYNAFESFENKKSPKKLSGFNKVRLILPEDIFNENTIGYIEETAVKKIGELVFPVIKSSGYLGLDEKDLKENLKFENSDKNIIMICFEAWQPPVKQTIDYLKNIRQIAGNEIEIAVLLIGKPENENIFSKVKENDYNLWNFKIKSIKDPLLTIIKLNSK